MQEGLCELNNQREKSFLSEAIIAKEVLSIIASIGVEVVPFEWTHYVLFKGKPNRDKLYSAFSDQDSLGSMKELSYNSRHSLTTRVGRIQC